MFPILHLLVLLQLRHTATAAANSSYSSIYTYCPNPVFGDTIPYAFQANLHSLFSDLFSAANHATDGFSSAAAGEATPYPLYGISLCRGDINPAICACCVANAATNLASSCLRPKQEAVIWYDVCMIKYSSAPFLGNLDGTGRAFPKTSTVDGNLTAFNSVLAAAVSKVTEEASATGLGMKKFATVEGRVNGSLTVYMMGQCTPDLSSADCRQCLEECTGFLNNNYFSNKVGGLVLFASCNLRYEVYPFYYSNGDDGSSIDAGGGCISHMRRSTDISLLLIELSVPFIMVLVLILFVLGYIRRFCYVTNWYGIWIMLLSNSIKIGIPSLLGSMRLYPGSASLFFIWTNFLIFVYGRFDTMTAVSFSDNERSVWTLFSFLPLALGILGFKGTTLGKLGPYTSGPLILLYVLSLLNTFDTVLACAYASKTEILPKITAPLFRFLRTYMTTGDKVEAELDSESTTDPYSQLVEWNYAPEKIFFMNPRYVWRCKGPLLNPSAGNDDDKKRSRGIKDICYSYNLFTELLTRFAGYSFPKIPRNRLKESFIDVLISKGGQIQDGVFSIIEVELEFLFDFFYTKFYYLFSKRWPRIPYPMKRQILGIGLFLAFLGLEFSPYQLTRRANAVSISSIQLLGYRVDVAVTRMVIVFILALEVVQLCQRFFSNWKLVNLICRYARDYECRRKKIKWIEKEAVCVSSVRFCISGILKPWKRKIGQYSLLESYNHVPNPTIHFLLGHHVFKQRVGKKESPAVALSDQVKQAILAALKDSNCGLTLSRGNKSSARHGVGWIAEWFDKKDERITSDAHFILFWHIATSVCEHPSSMDPSQVKTSEGYEHFRVATELSKYCAYLLVFAPELVSAIPSNALDTFDQFIEQARDKFKRTRSMKIRCIKLLELGTNIDINNPDPDPDDLLGIAGMLANHLRSDVLNKPDRGWRVMAEFWAELLLYLAPTENVTAHGERLARGGEFITHLWALLTHAGIPSRDFFESASS